MGRLLRIELQKIISYRTIQVLFGLFFLLLLGMLAGGEHIVSMVSYAFPEVWANYGYMAVILNIMLGILIIFICCNEYTFRTIRQNIIDGLTRRETVVSKILLLLLISVTATLFVYISGAAAGMMKTENASFSQMFDRNEFVLGYFVQTLGLLSFAYLCATIFKKSAVSILIFLIYLFPIDLIIRETVLPDSAAPFMPASVWFMHIIEPPLKQPDHVSWPAVVASLLYTILFWGINLLIIRKRDL